MKKSLLIATSALLMTLSLTSCNKKNCVPGKDNPDCICTMEYDPVCGCDGVTYSNECFAGCSGVSSYTPGECK